MKTFKHLTVATLALAAILPATAQAQTRELRDDRREIREERRDLNRALRQGDRRDVRDARSDLREARQEYREDLSDYRRYRASNRNAFRQPGFRAPFRYQSYAPGARIAASHYARPYVVSNYGAYRLPRPGANRAWVRHYNDVLLVNVRTGNVVRVIPRFYW